MHDPGIDVQVNKTVLAAATKDVRGLAVEDELDSLAREARCAAFACGSALVSATQEKEALFAILFKGSSNSDPSGVDAPSTSLCLPSQFALQVHVDGLAAISRGCPPALHLGCTRAWGPVQGLTQSQLSASTPLMQLT